MYEKYYQAAISNPEQFWETQAKNIAWYEFPKTILSQDKDGLYRWYSGGKLNTCYLALDYHCENGRGEQVALHYDSPVTGVKKSFTYDQMRAEVAHLAGVLRNLGVEKGDRVVIYMPLVPEAIFAMLACARLGAIHSVVFGGFAARELAIRIDDATPNVILTASGGKEFDKIIPYKPIIDEAIKDASHKVSHVVVLQREFITADMTAGRDHDWQALLNRNLTTADCVPVDATDPLYILYTSGTTGKPKGIVRDNGGHAVMMQYSFRHVYGMQAGEVFWAGSDVGWVVGHSYIVYAPLIAGCTTLLYEGKPIKTPDAGAYWRIIEEYGVNVFFTAPTGIRAVKREDPDGRLLAKYDLKSLRYLFLAGERCDVATWQWATDLLNRPVIDHWWQTESGAPMIANMVGVEILPIKPGSPTKCVPTFDIKILNNHATELPPNEEGAVAIKLPLPPGCLPNLWENTQRFKESYLSPYPGYYFSGDGGYKDDDGYLYITGRIDDVINVAGHRLSTADMEEILALHDAVAECAVVGIEDNLKGQIPVGFVILKTGVNIEEDALEAELVAMVRAKIGAVACFRKALIVKRLPKTRSGKILRKIMRYIADGTPFTPPSTIEDIAVLAELKELIIAQKVGNACVEIP
jgi:acyl-coenzyme A synthetase/AMP-(fatty) acid ligase